MLLKRRHLEVYWKQWLQFCITEDYTQFRITGNFSPHWFCFFWYSEIKGFWFWKDGAGCGGDARKDIQRLLCGGNFSLIYIFPLFLFCYSAMTSWICSSWINGRYNWNFLNACSWRTRTLSFWRSVKTLYNLKTSFANAQL